MAKKITQMTAADVADLGALTTMFEVANDVTTVPLTRKIGLGKIATWLATVGFLASTIAATAFAFTTTVTSVTAQATLGAMAATQGSFYASTVSGATLQGYGTAGDVTLKNRAGTDVLKIGPNTTAAVFAGAVTSSGNLTVGASTFVVTAATGGAISTITTAAGTSVAAYTAGGSQATEYVAFTTGSSSLIGRTAGTDGFVAVNTDLFTYKSTGFAEYIGMNAGEMTFWSVVSGTAGAALGTATSLLALTPTLAKVGTALDITGALTGVTTLAASSTILSSGPTGGIGYTTGAGGAQTQLTNKQTGVTSNTITTAITLNAESLAAGAITAFTFTDSAIVATDTVVVIHQSAGTSGAYTFNAFPAAGSAVISIRNNTAGALAEAIVLRVTVVKSVSA